MSLHHLESTQVVPVSLEECWTFFSSPKNLSKITPAALDFTILSDVPEKMHAGLKIEYRVRPLFGIPMRWISEITEVEPLKYFVDEQRKGPYKTWHHRHEFRALDEHRTEMRDRVDYEVGFGALGDIVNVLIVKRQLQTIFDFRSDAVERLFGKRR